MATKTLKTPPKISVKIWRPIIDKLDQKLDAACLRRDAYLNKVLENELPWLDSEVSLANSPAAQAFVAARLDQLDRKLVSLTLRPELIEQLNDICQRKRIVRDAFFNRLFLLLALKPKGIDWKPDTVTGARVMAFIEPRGVEYFLDKLSKESSFPVAVTGSIAAKQWATYAPAKAAYAYVSSIQEASEQWGLRPNAAAPNVILLEPKTVGDVPFVNTVSSEAGYPIAAPAQVAADLLNGPGREPAEGEYLIEWLKANEKQWRRD